MRLFETEKQTEKERACRVIPGELLLQQFQLTNLIAQIQKAATDAALRDAERWGKITQVKSQPAEYQTDNALLPLLFDLQDQIEHKGSESQCA